MGSVVLTGATSGSTTITPTDAVTATVTLPSTGGTLQTSGAGFTTNGVAYASSTSALATGSSLVWTGSSMGVNTSTPDIFSRGYGTVLGVSNTGSSGTAIQINSGTSAYPILELGRGGTRTAIFDSQSTKTEFGNLEAVPLVFLTNSAEAMRIDTSQNLLVGTTGTIGNNGKFCIVSTGGATNDFYVTKPTVNQYYNPAIFLNSSGTNIGYIQCSTSTTAYSTSSDYRLKNTITPMTGALAKVALLKPCTYKWNANGSEGQGFIAHELAEVCPDAVTGVKDAVDADGKPVYQGIDTSFLVATLTSAIQELSTLITAQQSTIQSLTERITALEGART